MSFLRTARAFVLWFAALAGSWLVITGSDDLPELALGGTAAAALAIVATAAARGRGLGLAAPWRRLSRAWRPMWRQVADIRVVTLALWRRLVVRDRVEGRLRAVRFAGGDDPEDAARRALTEFFGSLAANRYVIGADPEAEYVLVHELVSSDERLDPLELG